MGNSAGISVVDSAGRLKESISSAPAVSGDSIRLLTHVGQLDIVNTGSETDLFSYNVPANTLGNGTHHLRLTIDGDQLNSSGSTDVITLKIIYGSTTMYQDIASYTSQALRISWRFVINLGNASATNDQYMLAAFMESSRGGATTGNGDFNTSGLQNAILSGTAAEDSTTGTLTFKVTIQHSVTNSTTSWRRKFASLELV